MERAHSTRLSPERHCRIERLQSLLQTLPEAFALPFTADVVDTHSAIAFEQEGGSAVNAASTGAGCVMGLGKPDDTGDVGRGVGDDGGRGEAGQGDGGGGGGGEEIRIGNERQPFCGILG